MDWKKALVQVQTALLRLWAAPSYFLTAVIVFQVFLARNTFHDGIWADNDSVCHFAYARHLVEEFAPKTGTFLGYSPRFNMGVPFLLFNTPPGVYLGTFALTKLGLSTLTAIKVLTVSAFCAVPILGYFLGRTYDTAKDSSLPQFTALSLCLFSSELFGLEFFFRNGMLNPAYGIPLLLATLLAFRHALLRTNGKAIPALALGAMLFAATVVTHVLTAYMLTLALLCITIGDRWKTLGQRVWKMGFLLAFGGVLAAFWLVPSAPFAAPEDAAYTWLRNPSDTLSAFADGSLISSYFAGFFPGFVQISNVGISAVAFGAIGVYFAFRNRTEVRGLAILAILALLITVGPFWSFGIRLLPGYDRLLWYRFATLLVLAWLLLAAYGAHELAKQHVIGRYVRIIAGAAAVAAIAVLLSRGRRVQTAGDFKDFLADYGQVANVLRADPVKGRIFSEFLGFGTLQPPSVNYVRHLLPVDTGFEEAAGWIYENNEASRRLMKRGPFWYNSAPIAGDAERLALRYVVAGSSQLVKTLENDARWTAVLRTSNLVLFSSNSKVSLATIGAQPLTIEESSFLQGGGYRYRFSVPKNANGIGVVRVNDFPAWTATVDGKPVPHRSNVDGLLEFDAPPDAKELVLEFSIEKSRTLGRRISIAGLLFLVALVALSSWKEQIFELALLEPSGKAILAVASVLALLKGARNDLSHVGFGVREGLTASSDPHDIILGTLASRGSFGPLQVPADSSSANSLHGSVRLTAHSSIRLEGGADSHRATIGKCTMEIPIGTELSIPANCGSTEFPAATEIAIEGPVRVVHIRDDIRYLEAESFRNEVHDSGYEAFYSMGQPEDIPSNGALMSANVSVRGPIDLEHTLVSGAAGATCRYWAYLPTYHSRFAGTRADVRLLIDGNEIGSVDGADRNEPAEFWNFRPTYGWRSIGVGSCAKGTEITARFARKKSGIGGLADVDLFALIPQ